LEESFICKKPGFWPSNNHSNRILRFSDGSNRDQDNPSPLRGREDVTPSAPPTIGRVSSRRQNNKPQILRKPTTIACTDYISFHPRKYRTKFSDPAALQPPFLHKLSLRPSIGRQRPYNAAVVLSTSPVQVPPNKPFFRLFI